MTTKEIVINENRYTFKLDCVPTERGFSHTCSLLVNGTKVGKNSADYYNRTWESYTYQTVMKNTVRKFGKSIPDYIELNTKL
jgi:hypothetical protein